MFTEIRSKNGKQIVVGSMYKPPNMSIEQYSENLTTIVNKINSRASKQPPEIILGMDHNMNLLNSLEHKPTNTFMNTLSNRNLYPTITRPTCIIHHSGTLIDNIFISETLYRSFESCILIEDISDHLPLLVMLKQTLRCLNEEKLK